MVLATKTVEKDKKWGELDKPKVCKSLIFNELDKWTRIFRMSAFLARPNACPAAQHQSRLRENGHCRFPCPFILFIIIKYRNINKNKHLAWWTNGQAPQMACGFCPIR
jgi:hypothetical protein